MGRLTVAGTAVAGGLLVHLGVCVVGRWGSRLVQQAVLAVAIAGALTGLVALHAADPLGRMLGVIALVYAALEAVSVTGPERGALRALPLRAWLVFTFAWPGVAPGALHPDHQQGAEEPPPTRWLLRGARNAATGLVAVGALVVWAERLSDRSLGLAVILAVLLLAHLGLSEVVSAVARAATRGGYRLFDAPLASRSLGEFWGRRWNRPFSELNRVLFVPWLRSAGAAAPVVGAFVASAALHELAISYPAGAGFGRPTAYFLAHGLLVLSERRLGVAAWPSPIRRAWTLGWVLLPLPVLFHGPFRQQVIVEPLRTLGAELPPLAALPVDELLAAALLAAGAAHFLVLVASVQVPARLNWREELSSLTPFNRKLMWVYGGFIAGLIVAFGVLTLTLTDAFIRGDPAAVGLALLIGLFWAARVVVDAVVFNHDDWPSGWAFALGHLALTGLFVALAGVYLATTALHLWR